MKRIMLTGMRHSGKTALVENLCNEHPELDIRTVRINVGDYIKSLGYDPNEQVSLKERLALQTKILKKWYEVFTSVERPTNKDTILISDQSPIDFMAYTLADINRGITEDENEIVRLYIEACNEILYDILTQDGSHLIHVHPWTDPLKVTLTPYTGRNAFEEHCRLLILGAVTTLEETNDHITHIAQNGDLEARTWALHQYITGSKI